MEGVQLYLKFLMLHISKKNLYIIFEVLLMQTPSSSISKIFRPFLAVTLDIATFSWQCEKTGCGRYTTIYL